MRINSLLFYCAVIAGPCAGTCSAGMYSSVVVYGDSLSDNGNLFAATGSPGSPYYNGRASNGLVAVGYLAALSGPTMLTNATICDRIYELRKTLSVRQVPDSKRYLIHPDDVRSELM